MYKKPQHFPGEYVAPLYMNGVRGRMLYLPSSKYQKREILLVYDRLGQLEGWWHLVRVLSRYGSVTQPDLPGFGGMQSFYKIHEQPTIDKLADYLASFIKLRFNHKRLTIIGIGFGFVVVTRMLQRYPDVSKKVDLVVSLNGYAHKDDFNYSVIHKLWYLIGGWVGSRRVPAPSLQLISLRSFVIRWYYLNWPSKKPILKSLSATRRKQFLDKKVIDWQSTNLRTHLSTLSESMTLDNCKKRVNIPLWHISTVSNKKLNSQITEQHLRIIYSNYRQASVKVTPIRLETLDMKAATQLLPPKLRRLLAR